MPQVIRSPRQYDVCIIGSGAGGGMAAKVLTEGGLNCALLEAGPNGNPEKDIKKLMWPDQAPHRRAGLGEEWAITYEDLAPYYDKVEAYIGVFGTKENVSSAPDGVFLPPPKPRCTELMVKKACDKLNIICIPSRLAVITRSLNGRAPCHYSGQCGRGCFTASNFSSTTEFPPPAMKTGKLTLVTGAMAREILVIKDGKAEGVSYVDKATRTEKRINARAIVVAASACESARLLLNSKSAAFPGGIANSSRTGGR